MKRIAFSAMVVSLLVAGYLSLFGIYPRYFDIEWNEEVLLHDGRKIIVHIRRTFERAGMLLQRWRGILRSAEFSFNAGPPLGTIRQLVDRGDIYYLEQNGSSWYSGFWKSRGVLDVDVGQEPLAIYMYKLGASGRFERLPNWDALPVEFKRPNIMPPTPDPLRIAKFHGKLLSTEVKRRQWGEFPRGAGDPFPELRRLTVLRAGQQVLPVSMP